MPIRPAVTSSCAAALGLALLCIAAAAEERAEGPRTNVVVVLVDTLRADRLGCYGYPRPTSPFLDSLAAEGVLFEHSRSSSSYTRETVSALMTGLLPSHNGSTGTDARPSGRVPTLAEHFRAAGHRTGFFTLSPVLGDAHFSRGFDRARRMGTRGGSREGFALSDAAADFVDEAPGAPFLLYVHYLDPHSPYWPPEALQLRFAERVLPEPLGLTVLRRFLPRYLDEGFGPGEARYEDMQARYDGEIAHTDQAIQRLLGRLDAAGALARTLVVVTADHGEEFLEHGFVEHAWTLYEESIRVPLVFWAPGLLAPERAETPVSTVDVLPTLLDLASVDPGDRPFDGAPLFRAREGGWVPSRKARPVVSELLIEERCMLRSVVEGDLKYLAAMKWLSPEERSEAVTLLQTRREAYLDDPELRTGIWAPTLREELYDLSADPAETTDLSGERPAVLARMRARLETLRSDANSLAPEPAEGDAPAPPDAETRERLRALGYIGADE